MTPEVAALRQEYILKSTRERWGEGAVVAVLLGFEPIARDDRFTRHVSRSGVDWDAILAVRTWSPSERFLIATAAGAWSGRRTMADISRIAWLDDAFFGTWIDMIRAITNGHVPNGPGCGWPGGDHR